MTTNNQIDPRTFAGLPGKGWNMSLFQGAFLLLQTSGVESWGDALRGAIADSLAMAFGAIPKVIGFLVILIVGWIVAGIVSRIVARVLKAARFDEVGERAGANRIANQLGVSDGAVGLIALIVKWFIRLIALVAAFDALGISEISELIQNFVLWIPNLIVALVILMIAGLLANVVYRVVRATVGETGLGDPDLLATIAKFAVWFFAIVVVANQLGIAEDAVNVLFTGVVAAMAIALGLAFGLGGRDTAAEIVRGWHGRFQNLTQPGDASGGASTPPPSPPPSTGDGD